jgi:hypothetical protein
VRNPDGSTVAYRYDSAGEVIAKQTDGVWHAYSYDAAGRQTADAAYTLSGDSLLRQDEIDTHYDTLGNATEMSKVNDGIVNQVKRIYNSFGQLLSEKTSATGAVPDSASGVTYIYALVNDGNRLTDIVYPDGLDVQYNYSGTLNDSITRVDSVSIAGDSQPVETYQYLGLTQIVDRDRPQEQVDQSYFPPFRVAPATNTPASIASAGCSISRGRTPADREPPAHTSIVSNTLTTPMATRSTRTTLLTLR